LRDPEHSRSDHPQRQMPIQDCRLLYGLRKPSPSRRSGMCPSRNAPHPRIPFCFAGDGDSLSRAKSNQYISLTAGAARAVLRPSKGNGANVQPIASAQVLRCAGDGYPLTVQIQVSEVSNLINQVSRAVFTTRLPSIAALASALPGTLLHCLHGRELRHLH